MWRWPVWRWRCEACVAVAVAVAWRSVLVRSSGRCWFDRPVGVGSIAPPRPDNTHTRSAADRPEGVQPIAPTTPARFIRSHNRSAADRTYGLTNINLIVCRFKKYDLNSTNPRLLLGIKQVAIRKSTPIKYPIPDMILTYDKYPL